MTAGGHEPVTAAAARGDEGVLAERLESVRARVRAAADRAGRDPAAIRLLAVTKGQPVEAIGAALAVGLDDIGESRVQEAQAKQAALAGRPIRWHMIGHVQRNKARAAATMFDVVHSIDSVALAEAIDRHRAGGEQRLPVLVELELTGLTSRSGVAPGDAPGVLRALRDLPHLSVVGLMTIAPPGPLEAARDCFARLRVLRDQLREAEAMPLNELSMGMSGDFEIAVAEGATMVRLGRVLFGDRPAAGN